MWVVVEFTGKVNANGVLLGMEFGEVKSIFRHHLDTEYDHHLLLNKDDPYAKLELPGLRVCNGDPTTEQISKWIGEWATEEFGVSGLERVKVEVWETQVNSATWEADV
jgi:6-pyruvoyl-tetrahydropterin synthase